MIFEHFLHGSCDTLTRFLQNLRWSLKTLARILRGPCVTSEALFPIFRVGPGDKAMLVQSCLSTKSVQYTAYMQPKDVTEN